MTRPALFLVLAVVLAVGAVWSTGGSADAARKRKSTAGSCADELARTQAELAAAREDARKAREEAKAAKAEAAAAAAAMETMLKAEAARTKRLQEQLGTEPVDNLK